MAAATVHRKAAELLDNGKITARLQELRRKAVAKGFLSLEAHLYELALLRDGAMYKGQYSAAIRAEELRGRLCRLYEEPKVDEQAELEREQERREAFCQAEIQELIKGFQRAARGEDARGLDVDAFKPMALPGPRT